MASAAELSGGSRTPSLDGLQPICSENRPQEILKDRGAIPLGNRALQHIASDIFDPQHGYVIASVGGTFHRPFTRDSLISGHLLRKGIEGLSEVGGGMQTVWNDVTQNIKTSFDFLWRYQKRDGFLTHEMERYRGPQDENHPMLTSGFYTHEQGSEFMINGDSVDATPRGLMEAVRILSHNEARAFTPKALHALDAIQANMDAHGGFLTYDGHNPGLMSQGWMDSWGGRPLDSSGNLVPGSVALVEVQAYAWSAMKRWGNLLQKLYPDDAAMQKKAEELQARAHELKERFNKDFRTQDGYFAHALVMQAGEEGVFRDERVSINAGLAIEADVRGETIFATDEDIRAVVSHLMQPTMFHENAGIFTFDANSVLQEQRPDSYHYGVYVCWPFASVLAAEGIIKVSREKGWKDLEAVGDKIMLASMMPMLNSTNENGEKGTFLEQFTYTPGQEDPYVRFTHAGTNEQSNTIQTWTIAAFIRGLSHFGMLGELDYPLYEKAKTEAADPSRRREYRTAFIFSQ